MEALVDLCFGYGRYAKTAYRLREGVAEDSRLSFVAEADPPTLSASAGELSQMRPVEPKAKTGADGKLLGSVRFWPISVGGAPSLLLGPLAVQPHLRGQGIGVSLMKRGIEEAKALGYGTIILVGDEPYYARVGFTRLKPGVIQFPGPVNPERVLGLALKAGALAMLSGAVTRAHIDEPVAAAATAL